MEQTLGKRIAENRKRLGLTQDSLAEKLGITAQAVSKWENDQSCPDITMLPRLAEIFGITTDALLGLEEARPVHEAEVMEDDGPLFNIDQNENGKWEFHWDSGKRGAVTFAIFVLMVGLLTLANQILGWGASFWGILWPSALLIYGVEGIVQHFSVFKIGMILCGGAFLINNLGLCDLDISRDWIFPLIVILFGVSLLVDALKKPSKPRFRVVHNGKNVGSSKKTRCECSNSGGGFNCDLCFAEKTFDVCVPVLQGGNASVCFGELTVDLSGCEAVGENCAVSASCSFGELVLLVPRRYRVDASSGTAFASMEVKGHPDPEPVGIIHLDANVSFGQISIRYI